jgi:hypothetical protein
MATCGTYNYESKLAAMAARWESQLESYPAEGMTAKAPLAKETWDRLALAAEAGDGSKYLAVVEAVQGNLLQGPRRRSEPKWLEATEKHLEQDGWKVCSSSMRAIEAPPTSSAETASKIVQVRSIASHGDSYTAQR